MSSSGPETDGSDSPYDQLLERSRKLTNLQYAQMYLNWDQQVMMPEGGAQGRAQQLSTISSVSHDLLVDDDVEAWLEAIDETELSEDEAANIRELRRRYEREAEVPTELTEKLTQAAAENQQIWQEAKAENDFESFAPRLEQMRDLQIEMAECIDPDKNPYAVLYEENHPYIPLEKMEEIFATLRAEIPPLVEEIRESGAELADPWEGEYPEERQRALCEAALDFLGYDRERGRLDTAAHPFMAGNQFDARVTTRFKDEEPMDALTATIHEFGHATYQLGLRPEEYGTPLGSARMSIHESQSRFWENHIGRTEPFWEVFLPTFKEHVDGHDDLTPRELYEAANRIYPNNLIRVEADELTYHMHIILRCEIDRAFVEGEIEVDEIPQVWNEKMDEYLGVRPESDSEGCLQDIHWSSRFAGFQTYTLGSVVAAQLNDAIRSDLDVDALVREENFEPIHEWMTEHVHSHGQRYETPELIERATGQELSAEPFVDYVREKFERLYDL